MTTTGPIGALRSEQPLHEHVRAHAARTPQRTAIIWYGCELSYGELDRLSDAAASLLHRHGVRQGDPVALFMQNCPQYVIAHLAVQKLGAIVSPCSPLFKSAELAYQLSDLGAEVIIAAANLHPVVASVLDQTSVRTVVLVHYADLLPETPTYAVPAELAVPRADVPGTIDLLATIRSESEPPPRPTLSLDDVSLLVYTSGTTGRPKGAMLTYGNCIVKTSGLARLFELGPDEVHLANPPLYHISGMLYGMNLPLYTGASFVLHYRFDPLATLQSIACHHVTYWKGIAPMLPAVMDVPGAENFDLSSLRVTSASSFGIRTTLELSQRWAAFTGGCAVTEAGYGLSETHTGDVVTLPHEVRWGTNGRPMPGVRCRIVDPQTLQERPAGKEGEILLSSPGNFRGYWK